MKFIKLALFSIVMLMCFTVRATPIVWDPSLLSDSSDATDVVNTGLFIEAVNATNTNSGSYEVNGVTFSNSNNLLNKPGYVGALNGAALTNNYLNILNTFDYGGGSGLTELTLGNGLLIKDKLYMIQVWYTDIRSCCSSRDMELDNVSDTELNAFGNGLGQNIVGEFFASSGYQTLSLDPQGFKNSHINAYQIREVTSTVNNVPEPSTLLVFAFGVLGLICRKTNKLF